MGVEASVHLVKDGRYGGLENGSWNGMIGELMRGEAQIAVAPLTIGSERKKAVQFTEPFLIAALGFIQKKPSLFFISLHSTFSVIDLSHDYKQFCEF